MLSQPRRLSRGGAMPAEIPHDDSARAIRTVPRGRTWYTDERPDMHGVFGRRRE